MLNSLLLAMALIPAQETPIVNLQQVPFTEVKITDKFWAPRQKTNREVSIPHTFKECETTGRLANFDLAAKGARTGFKGLIFDDSDVYKSLEAAAYALAEARDPKLEAATDKIIARVAAAQMADGYLNTWYQINAPDKRFTNLADNHELYCAGHLFEAAVAHYQATGKKTLLDVATKYADLLVRTFGDGPGKRMGYCGHPESELALMKLWKATGKQEYFDLAKFFLDNRGTRFFAEERKVPKDKFDGTYWLDDVPIREHKEIKGHAVRAAYLLSGAADLASVTGDQALRDSLDRVWRNTVFKRVFVTGGIGPSASNEGFTVDYDLPNMSAYQETCASVAMVLWNHRMGLMEGDGKYWDWVERALYNGFLSGVSLKGDRFFYVNPLASTGGHHRSEWFGCACCPPNVTRTLASLGNYVYAKSNDALYVNLFVGGSVKTKVGESTVVLDVETDYPWDGTVVLRPRVTGPRVGINLRVPGWAQVTRLSKNGGSARAELRDGYLRIPPTYQNGDTFTFRLPLDVMRIEAHPAVKENAERLAVQRGPLIYCLEGADNPDVDLTRLFVPLESKWSLKRNAALGNIVTLHGQGFLSEPRDWRRKLYVPVEVGTSVNLTAIPYYAWDNRNPGGMEVWLRTSPPPMVPGGLEQLATVSLSYKSDICTPDAVKDGKAIEASNKHPGQLCHFWPHKGSKEWVQYSWKQPVTTSGVEVYWFDDTGFGECRPPVRWHIEAQDTDGQWRKVAEGGGLKLDGWNALKFEPVTTSALRLILDLQPQWSVGVHEWRVMESED
ncbi:MAG: glycoside hydrolase family 127 protein [Fimbriimonadaceae bacterium]|nr:glycoside hydrolase family 127 protein [Fimbriimonadaceae bacterium]